MPPQTLTPLFGRDRRNDRPALEDDTGRVYDAHWLCTTSWKAGNFLRHTGVRRGVTVGIVGNGPLSVVAFFGTALLEGRTVFDPTPESDTTEQLRTLVAPVDDLTAYDLPRGAQQVGYGDRPTDPAVHHFEAGLWSENPSFPPLEIDPETPLVTDGENTYTHETILQSARTVAREYGLEAGTRVGIADSFSDPRVVTAGLVAPLLTESVIVLLTASPTDAETSRVDWLVEPDAVTLG